MSISIPINTKIMLDIKCLIINFCNICILNYNNKKRESREKSVSS